MLIKKSHTHHYIYVVERIMYFVPIGTMYSIAVGSMDIIMVNMPERVKKTRTILLLKTDSEGIELWD